MIPAHTPHSVEVGPDGASLVELFAPPRADWGALDRLDKDRLTTFARGCAVSTGGYRGGLWDERADVEYTFYGLGVLALCS